MRRLQSELKALRTHALEDIVVLANDDDLTSVHALIEGPKDTPYENGLFRVRLKFGSDYPAAPPKGAFA